MSDLNFLYNVHYSFNGITLYLDIDKKTEVIKSAFFKGGMTSYDLHVQQIINRSLDELESLDFSDGSNADSLFNVPYWMIKEAISSYRGDATRLKSSTDLLCLCFGVTKKDIKRAILKDQNFDLSKLVQETMASSACGSCLAVLKEAIEELRGKLSIVYGKGKIRSAYDKDGNWLKIDKLYPGALLIKIDELYKEWVKKEEIEDFCDFEIVDIEGYYIDFKTKQQDVKKAKAFLEAFNEYASNKLNAIVYFSFVD